MNELVARQLKSFGSFDNYLGITLENVHSFLDAHDAETSSRLMWVVLRTHKQPEYGYFVVYDPDDESRGVAEATSSSTYLLIISAPTFDDALSGM